MKLNTISKLFVFAVALLVLPNAKAQTAEPASSLLYEVTGKGLAKPSYILGTIHAACTSDIVPMETISPYLGRTDEVLMELDLDDAGELGKVAGSLMIPGGKTIKDYLKPEEFAKVDAMVTSVLGISAENVKSVKPMMLSVLLTTSPKAIGCAAPVTFDLTLAQTANAAKKPVTGLETAEQQMMILDSKPIAKQVKELYDMSLDVDKSLKEMKDLLEAYRTRSSDRLYEMAVTQSKDDKEFMKRLLDDRNAAWIPKLESSMKARPTFVAVGAAHLGGKNGVLNLLRAKGYSVTPVKI